MFEKQSSKLENLERNRFQRERHHKKELLFTVHSIEHFSTPQLIINCITLLLSICFIHLYPRTFMY